MSASGRSDLGVASASSLVVRFDVVDDDVDALVDAAELTRGSHPPAVLECSSEHDHAVAEAQLGVRDLAVGLVHGRPLEAEGALEPVDRGSGVVVAQECDAVHGHLLSSISSESTTVHAPSSWTNVT